MTRSDKLGMRPEKWEICVGSGGLGPIGPSPKPNNDFVGGAGGNAPRSMDLCTWTGSVKPG